MENNNKKTVWGIVIVVVLIIIGAWIWSAKSNQSPTTVVETPATTTDTMTSTGGTSGVQVGVGTGEPTLTYTEALVEYASRRVQFSNPQGSISCQATPTTVTFKGGTKFMLDNRMNVSAKIHFSNGVNYTVPAYSFQVVILNTPQTYNVDCNLSQNVAKVQIQK